MVDRGLSMTSVRRKVLVVDDDPDLVFRVRQILEDTYEVYATSDWAELNKRVFRDHVDLILMDVNLPVLRGDQLVQVIRGVAAKGGLRPKILYYSAEDETTMDRLVRTTGADGYVSKSLRAPQLLEAIAAAIGKG